jgi:hypothetical protein
MKTCSVWRGEYLLATPLDGVAVNVGDLSGFAAAAQPSGSKLPRHEGVWAGAITSRLAPTGGWGCCR